MDIFGLSYLGEGKPGDLFEPTGEGAATWEGGVGGRGSCPTIYTSCSLLERYCLTFLRLNIFSLLLGISSVCELKPRIEENVT